VTGKATDVTCSDCYFKTAGLCALSLEAVCPTFRASTRAGALAPPRQPRLVPLPPLPLTTQLAATA
jgi:hypothetical protein